MKVSNKILEVARYVQFLRVWLAGVNDIFRLIPSFKHENQNTFLSMVQMTPQRPGDMPSHLKPDVIEICEKIAIDSLYVPKLVVSWTIS